MLQCLNSSVHSMGQSRCFILEYDLCWTISKLYRQVITTYMSHACHMHGHVWTCSFHADELPCHPQVLREASGLCNQLPVLDKALFNKDFHSVSAGMHVVAM